jgi:2-methylcitrate dehydratase PrpD
LAISNGSNAVGTEPGSLTAKLVDLIRSKPVTDTDLEMAALFTLDAIANTCAGQNSDPGQVLMSWFNEAQKTNQETDSGKTAFLLGALTHILETDDLHRASVVHPGCVVVPPAWVMASRNGISGRKFLTAVLHGFEATTRVGMAVGAEHYRIWHNTSTCGPFGSAMACAALLELDDAQATHALGNAGSQAAGLWEFLETGAMTKHLHAGHAAEAGLRAAELAKHGFTGPPKILEGEKGFFRATCNDPHPEAVLADADAPWQLVGTSIKPWPSCRHTHPAIDAAEEIRKTLLSRSIDPMSDEVESVTAIVYQAALDVCNRPDPVSQYEAKFSLQHTIAAGLGCSRVDFAAFDQQRRTDLKSLRAKVDVQLGDPYATAYPESWGSSVSVLLRNGETIEQCRTNAKGDPEAALSRDDMVEKAQMLLTHAGVTNPDAFIDAVLALPEDKALPPLSIDI